MNAVTHEFAAACGFGIELSEAALPVKPAVRGVCELLGLDALNFANEGKLVIAVERQAAESVLAALHAHPLGRDAAMIGEVVERKGVRLAGLYGVKRTLDFTTRRTITSYMLAAGWQHAVGRIRRISVNIRR